MAPSTSATPEQPQTFRQALARQQLRAAAAKSREQAHRDGRRDGLSEAIVDQLFATPSRARA